jgi:hypothetical protein
MALAELCSPIRAQRFHAFKQALAARKLDGVTLPVVEAEHFDARKARQRPGQAGGGILSA